jgi:hypothetical protein
MMVSEFPDVAAIEMGGRQFEPGDDTSRPTIRYSTNWRDPPPGI